jgi:hypothetical protein
MTHLNREYARFILNGMSPETDFESILNSYWLPELAQQINAKLASEATRRERFYDEMTESQKT